MSLHQDNDESFKTFATRVHSKAETCDFTTVSEWKFGKKNVTSYTEEAVKNMMLVDVGDDDLRRVVLSTETFCLGHFLT